MKKSCKYIVLLLTNQVGGAEKVLLEIAKYLASRGKDVEIIILWQRDKAKTTYVKGYAKDLKISAYSNNLFLSIVKTIFYFKNIPNMKQLFVFSSSIYTNALSFFIKNRKIQFIARDTTIFKGRYRGIQLIKYRVLYKFYKYIDLLIMQSDEMLLKNSKYIRNTIKMKVIHNPINIQDINKLKEEPVDIDAEYILAVGRLIPEKGFDILIKAFSKTYEINQRFKLMIIGEGGGYNVLVDLINKLNLRDRVLIRGLTNNPYKYMKHSYFNIVPSIREGFPNVLNEMMACNERIVVTRFNSEVDRIPGILVAKPGDINDLCRKMVMAIEYNFDVRAQLEYLDGIDIHKFIHNIDMEVDLRL